MKNLFNKLLFLLIINSFIISQSLATDPTELIKALDSGDMKKVQELINFTSDINKLGIYGDTFLTLASKRGRLEVVKELIKSGADVDKPDKDGNTPLMFASTRGYAKIVKELVNADANVNKSDKEGNTYLMFASSNGFIEIVKDLVKAGAVIDELNKYGDSALSVVINDFIRDFLQRIKNIEENINQIGLENLSAEEKIVLAKRLINQNDTSCRRFNIPRALQILDNLNPEQVAQVFTEREIRNLTKDT